MTGDRSNARELARTVMAMACALALIMFTWPEAGFAATPARAQDSQSEGADCSVVTAQALHNFCVAIHSGQCERAGGEWKLLCEGFVGGDCSLATAAAPYQECKALTTGDCTLIPSSTGYWYCKAVLSGDCTLADADLYWLCQATTAIFRRE